MSFEKLLEELDSLQTLQKSEPADMDVDNDEDGDGDDAGIAAAAAEGEGHAEPDGDEDEGSEGDGDGDEGAAEGMAKSLRFTTLDGEEVEGIDGTELVKSLIDRFDSQEETLSKALGSMVDLIKSQAKAQREQADLIKSLQGEIKRLGGEGRGRKAMLSVAEKPVAETLTKSEPDGINANEFMAKALSAQQDGKITGLDVSIAEASLNKGLPVPQHIVRRVIG